MKKIRIHNSYSDWSETDCVNMHRLELRKRDLFMWSNLGWAGIVAYLVSHNVIIVIIAVILMIIIGLIITNDREFYD